MSAPTTHDPLVVNTKDGVVWQRRAVTAEGRGLYAVTGSCSCPEFLMATLAELAEHGIAGSADVLPMPVGPQPRTLDQVENELTGVSLSLYEEELTTARLRLALKAAKRGRSELRSRVAVLEAERHTTNEALDDAVRELRTSYAERARRESHPGRRQAWRMLARAEEAERVAETLISPKASRSADRLRALLAGQRESGGAQ